MKRSISLVVAALSLVASFGAWAQATPTEGEVRKVDRDAQKITLKHGEIKSLDMPAMSMAYQVKDPSMLDKVKAGDKVRFTAEKVKGTYTVTSLQPAR